MASQLLIEGALDAKCPRGSENRKFWKAWRRQWAKFSVVYPSGRREPYLVLTLSHSSSEASVKEIKISRDGLRLFRCRSKSRPYRTWAITSGNKVVLYFAAESEIQAQNWMQAVRDGLWPPCFSFQMLTACSYEVSLIDDDNTFMAGHLGVYGRFVLTSEDVISLMHPHWGSTLLEISLNNIIDVLFIREADISPAGVFSIILKRIEGSNVKALQFFCNTAKDAMQWVLSKLYARRKSFSVNGSRKLSENRVSFSILEDSSSSRNSLCNDLDNEKTIFSIDSQLVSPQADSTPKSVTDVLNVNYLQPEYENVLSLSVNSFQSDDKYSSFDKEFIKPKINNMKNTPEEMFLERNNHYFSDFSLHSKSVDEKRLSISDENTCENIINSTTSFGVECLKSFGTTDDSTGHVNQYTLDKKLDNLATDLSLQPIKDETVEYAVVNKSLHKKSEKLHVEHVLAINENIYENFVLGSDSFIKSEKFNSPENFKNEKDNSSLSSKTSSSIFPSHIKNGKNKTKLPKNTAPLNYDLKFTEPSNSNDPLCITVHKNTSDISETVQYSVDSLSDQGNYFKQNHISLPNLPSDFLDTSLNSLNPRNKSRESSTSSEEDNVSLFSLIHEFDVLKMNEKMNEQIYEDLLERKGTIYEEVDESEDKFDNPLSSAPELPDRPKNLEIPESLRLQKLSRNIQSTLEVMEDKKSLKVLNRPNFIKKIKDVNRIMHISPKQECAKKPFEVESKLKINSRNETILPPNALNLASEKDKLL